MAKGTHTAYIKPFVTKDSGQRQDFPTGSRRDTNDGKPRYDLVPVEALRRWADLMARGAKKYGERNWTKGQSLLRYEESALRHWYQYIDGSAPEEDHLAGVLFNVGAIMHHEAMIETGQLPRTLDDRDQRRLAPTVDRVTEDEPIPYNLDPGEEA
jgi:hypothetical protein